jgi:hypothetical protein
MMTLIEQFPDISDAIREKNKIDMKNHEIFFKHLDNNSITQTQKFYDKEFRIWHYKLLVGIVIIWTALYFLILNARGILNAIVS